MSYAEQGREEKRRGKNNWVRWVAFVLLAMIVLRTGIMYQRWTRMYTNHAIEFANGLRNGAIYLADYQDLDYSDPVALEQLRESLSNRAESIGQTGASMEQNGRRKTWLAGLRRLRSHSLYE